MVLKPEMPTVSRRSALLVASSVYNDSQLSALRSPGRDASLLRSALSNPHTAAFDVSVLRNTTLQKAAEAIEGFFLQAGREELLLLHLSCHGVKDEGGELHFAFRNTRLDRLASTAVSLVSPSES